MSFSRNRREANWIKANKVKARPSNPMGLLLGDNIVPLSLPKLRSTSRQYRRKGDKIDFINRPKNSKGHYMMGLPPNLKHWTPMGNFSQQRKKANVK